MRINKYEDLGCKEDVRQLHHLHMEMKKHFILQNEIQKVRGKAVVIQEFDQKLRVAERLLDKVKALRNHIRQNGPSMPMDIDLSRTHHEDAEPVNVKGMQITQVGKGKFSIVGDYETIWEKVLQAMQMQNVRLKEQNMSQGRITGKCRYGINIFGMKVSALFFFNGPTINLEFRAEFVDAIDTVGACDKKVQELSKSFLICTEDTSPSEKDCKSNSQSSDTGEAYFNVYLTEMGDKIETIKVIREFLNCGLKEAKDFADGSLPVCILENADGERSNDFKVKLEAIGAGVNICAVGSAEDRMIHKGIYMPSANSKKKQTSQKNTNTTNATTSKGTPCMKSKDSLRLGIDGVCAFIILISICFDWGGIAMLATAILSIMEGMRIRHQLETLGIVLIILVIASFFYFMSGAIMETVLLLIAFAIMCAFFASALYDRSLG